MTPDHNDHLMARVRRSDPLAGAPPAAQHRDHGDHGDHADDAGRAAVTAARARRGERNRLGVGAGLGGLAALATAIVVALGATTAGPVAAKPRIRQIVARAAQATTPEPNTIVMIDSVREISWTGGGNDDEISSRGATFALFDGEGRIVANRALQTDARGEAMDSGAEEATYQQNGASVLEMYNPVLRETRRFEGARMVPSPVFQAHKLFVQAQRGEKRMRLLGRTRVGDRQAWRLLVTGADEEPLDGDRDEMLVDVATYEPLELRRHNEHVKQGERYTHDSVERVMDYEVLPDTPANRELLRLHGPTRPAE